MNEQEKVSQNKIEELLKAVKRDQREIIDGLIKRNSERRLQKILLVAEIVAMFAVSFMAIVMAISKIIT